jgi:hypothetical protein
MVLQFYELKKLAPLSDADSGRDLWLKLFNAETEEVAPVRCVIYNWKEPVWQGLATRHYPVP